MWIPFLLIIGVIAAVASSSASARGQYPPRQLALAAPPLPGPISVLGEFVRIGHVPPPTVILCAIAEAETIGRNDLASDIVRVFVAPVVYQHELANARRPHAIHERGSCAQQRPAQEAPYARGSCAPPRSPRDGARAQPPARGATSPAQTPSVQALRETSRHATDEEIRAMLNADPQAFLEMVKRGAPVIEVPVEAVHHAAQASMPSPPMPPLMQSLMPPVVMQPPMMMQSLMPPVVMQAPMQSHPQEQPQPSGEFSSHGMGPMGLPPEMVAQMTEAHLHHEAADQALAMAPGSPIGGVPDDAWREFVTRLSRESPTFSSSRHVGQYRQRRERLADLGVNPEALLGSAQAQRAALDADLVDAHHHAVEGGLLEEHLHRSITVPGHEGSATITRSGVLGVIQCAGLEGAVGWLEQPGDRKRFPHTTQAFLRTNGVF